LLVSVDHRISELDVHNHCLGYVNFPFPCLGTFRSIAFDWFWHYGIEYGYVSCTECCETGNYNCITETLMDELLVSVVLWILITFIRALYNLMNTDQLHSIYVRNLVTYLQVKTDTQHTHIYTHTHTHIHIINIHIIINVGILVATSQCVLLYATIGWNSSSVDDCQW